MLVSILIPCYNAEQWVGQAIESALAQTWPEKEVVVVDDGSKDGSLDIIRGFSERIRWETGPNRGGNRARNRLLELARGEWLQYLDADDYLLPEKIAGQMQFLEAHPETDVVYSPVIAEHWSENETRRELHAVPEPHDPWLLLVQWRLQQTGSALWRKAALEEVGHWKPDQPCCQEHELYLRLLMARKRFAYCGHNGAIYRLWSDDTVCRRDLCEVHRRRLEIEGRAESWLRANGELTEVRLRAINQARFEIARMAWQYDPAFASAIMETVKKSETGFLPGGKAASLSYQALYRVVGFRGAERVAQFTRGWLKRSST